MNNGVLQTLSPFKINCVLAIVIYIWAWSLACGVGSNNLRDNNACCKVNLNKVFAIILFFRFFNRKISLWAVIMQIINLLTLLANIITIYVFQINVENNTVNIVFRWINVINFLAMTTLLLIDMLIYAYKSWKMER